MGHGRKGQKLGLLKKANADWLSDSQILQVSSSAAPVLAFTCRPTGVEYAQASDLGAIGVRRRMARNRKLAADGVLKGSERVQQLKPSPSKVGRISSDDFQIVYERNGGNLLIERVGRVGDAQMPPYLSCFGIERENTIGELGKNRRQPLFKYRRLVKIAAMSDQIDAAAQFTDRYGR